MKKFVRGPLIYILILLAIFLIAQSVGSFTTKDKTILTYTEFLEKIQAGEITDITIISSEAVALKKDTTISENDFPSKYDYYVYLPSEDQLNEDMKAILGVSNSSEYATKYGITVVYKAVPSPSIWEEMLPYLLPVVLIAVFWYFMIKQSQGGNKTLNFGKSPSKDDTRRKH